MPVVWCAVCLAPILVNWKPVSVRLFNSIQSLPVTFSLHTISCNATKNPIYVFLFWELRHLSPNFHIHVSVSDLCIPRIGPHISCGRIGRSILGVYKSLTDTLMWKLGLWPRNSFSGNIFVPIFGIGSLQCVGVELPMPFIVFYLLLASCLGFSGSDILYRLLPDKILFCFFCVILYLKLSFLVLILYYPFLFVLPFRLTTYVSHPCSITISQYFIFRNYFTAT